MIEVKGGIISCVMLREQIQLIKKKRERERERALEKRGSEIAEEVSWIQLTSEQGCLVRD